MKNSIGLKLLRYIFGSYLLVTVALTLWQLHSEYMDTKSDVLHGMLNLEKTFKASLNESVWGYDINQLELTIQGMQHIDYIASVRINDNKGKNLAQTTGSSNIKHDSPMVTSSLPEPFQSIKKIENINGNTFYQHSFQLIHTNAQGKPLYIGDCHLFASDTAVFDRVSYGFTLIIVNSLLKTAALWFIFYFFTRKLVAKPMARLKHITEDLEPQKANKLRKNNELEKFLKTGQRSHDEISSFARSFNRMQQSIIHKMDLIEEQNSALEKRVIERTQELTNINKKLEEIATHDDLTGLPNRKLFNERLMNLSANALRGEASYALINIDLRKFKVINDTLGHQAGDAYLKEFAKRMTSITRDGDTVARMGGDEFCILLPFVNENTWQASINKLLKGFEQPFLYKHQPLTIQANIGIALFPFHSKEIESLMHMADVAMYHAKKTDQHYCFYQPALEASEHRA